MMENRGVLAIDLVCADMVAYEVPVRVGVPLYFDQNDEVSFYRNRRLSNERPGQ